MMNLILGMYQERLNNNIAELTAIFENAEEVYLYDVSKSPSGHGHYKITLLVDINGKRKEFKTTTSDMGLIDAWSDEESNVRAETIMSVISLFEDAIEEYLFSIE